jgi:hypothetical protein
MNSLALNSSEMRVYVQGRLVRTRGLRIAAQQLTGVAAECSCGCCPGELSCRGAVYRRQRRRFIVAPPAQLHSQSTFEQQLLTTQQLLSDAAAAVRLGRDSSSSSSAAAALC